MRAWLASATIHAAALGLLVACAAPEPFPQRPNLDGDLPYAALSEYRLFEGPLAEQRPSQGVWPYEPVSALWSDHAEKLRFLVLPEGETITLPGPTSEGGEPAVGTEPWDFPERTVLVKTFGFRDVLGDDASARRLIETRLLIKRDARWQGVVYLWNDEQTDARRIVAGHDTEVAFVEGGESVTLPYSVPNENQCKNCHEQCDDNRPLGPVTAQMNHDGQLAMLAALGAFSSTPDEAALPAWVDPFGEADLELRARSYLGANCAHCHNPCGQGGPSGLVLEPSETDPIRFGVCKPPVAAGKGAGGRPYDVVPGHPELSIMTYRMESTDPEVKMPELPNRLPDAAGVALITEWIAAMQPAGCPGL